MDACVCVTVCDIRICIRMYVVYKYIILCMCVSM